MLRLFITLLLLLSLSTPLSAATYYVRKTGNNGNTGTSPSQAWLTIQKAAQTLVAGDTVYIGAGTYTESVTPTNDGTSVNPIHFIADSSGTFTGDAGTVTLAASAQRALDINNDNYAQFTGLTISGGTSESVQVKNSIGGVLSGCEIHSSGGNGIKLDNATITIQSCTLRNHAAAGLTLDNQAAAGSANATLIDCRVYSNATHGLEVISKGTELLTVKRTYIYGNTSDGVRLNDGVHSITNSLITNNGPYGIYMKTGVTATVWHCTIAGHTTCGFFESGGTATVRNSILASNGGKGFEVTGGTLNHSYNCVYGHTTNFSGVSLASGEITSDPKFWSASSFDLQDSSPCLNTGTNPSGVVTDDLEAVARPIGTGYDMGCYEINPVTYTSLASAYTSLSPYAWWKLNESSGSTAIDTIGNHHGTYINGAVLGAVGGPFYTNNKAADFDGANDRVDLGNINPTVTTMSFIGWLKADDFDVTDADILAKTSGTSDSNYFWSLGTVASSGQQRLRFRFRAGGSTASVTASSGGLSTGSWVFVAGVYDGNALVLYKDGVEVGRTTKTGTPDASAAVNAAIGDIPTGTRPFDGLLDEMAIFTKALKPREIAAIYASALKGTFSGMVTVPKLWGVDEDDSNLFSTTNYPAMAAGNTTTYGRLKWNNGGVITNLPTTVTAMTLDRYGKAYFVCNSAVGGTAAPVLLSFDSANASASSNNVVTVIGHIPVSTSINGLAIDPFTSQLYALRNNGFIYAVNSTDASLTATIGQATGLGESIGSGQDLMFDPYGNLYILDDTDDELYRIHKSTAAILEVYNNGGASAGSVAGTTFDHLNNRMVVAVTDSDMLIYAPLSLSGFNTVSGLGSLGLTDVQAIAFVPSDGIKGNTTGVRVIRWKEIK